MGNYLVLTAIGTYLLGILSSWYSKFFQLFFLSIRVPSNKLAKIYVHLNRNLWWKFAFAESFPSNKLATIPDVEDSFIIYNRMPLWLNISEKYLTAGFSSKEEICSITTIRWNKKRLFKIFEKAELEKVESREYIDVYISRENYFRRMNRIKKNKIYNDIYLDFKTENQISTIIDEFNNEIRSKIGILLFGPPGNGKTSIIRKIACKFDYNIYIPIFRPDMTNDQIINLFSDISIDEKAIIVFEDFDSLFSCRYPIGNRELKFTFEVFLNILDGLYSSLENKIIFMTANNLDNIDHSLKNRPSRFDSVIKIDNPTLDVRLKLLENSRFKTEIANLTDGQSAAIIREISKRKIENQETLTQEIETIIASFNESNIDNQPMAQIISEYPISDGLFKSLKRICD